MNYLNTIKDFVLENFLFGDDGQLTEDTSFLESGIVDSTGVLELVTFLENTFDIRIEDDELVPEHLDNLKSITRFLELKLNHNS